MYYAIYFITEEEKLPLRRSHIGNQAYLDEMVTVNALHTEVGCVRIVLAGSSFCTALLL